MKIAIYFNSGNKAIFDVGKLDIRGLGDAPYGDFETDYKGMTLVNWANVCFMKEVEDKNDDDE